MGFLCTTRELGAAVVKGNEFIGRVRVITPPRFASLI